VGESADWEFRVNGAPVAALFGVTPNVGELDPPIQVASSLGVGEGTAADEGGGVDANPGGGVRTSLPTLGWRINPAFVTSSPVDRLAAALLADPAQVASKSCGTIARLHEGQSFAPSGTAAPQ
jgi:hypothetical protein